MTLRYFALAAIGFFFVGCIGSGPATGRVSPTWTTVEERELSEERAEKARLDDEEYPLSGKLGPVYKGVELVDRIPPVAVTKKSAFHTDVNLVDTSPNVTFTYKVKWGGGRKKEKRSKFPPPSVPRGAAKAVEERP